MKYPPIQSQNIYLEFIDSGYVSGEKITNSLSHVSEINTQYFTSFRELLKVGMNGSIQGMGYKLSAYASSETEFEDNYAKQTKDEVTSITNTTYSVPPGGKLGTVLYKMNFKFGGKVIPVVAESVTDFWNKNNIAEFKNRLVSPSFYDLLKRLDSATFTDEMEAKMCAAPQPVLALPVTGKTCHHVKFLEAHDDNCTIDSSNCVVLDGTSYVVCHHHDFQWIGGEGCDCNHIDNLNVLIVPEKQFA